jgi:hypothetical protein
MEHFPEHAWADFTRGIAHRERVEMDLHLANGCNHCALAWQTWHRVQEMATREAQYRPADGVVRMAKLRFANWLTAKTEPGIGASLILDTLAHPGFAGIRSRSATARQMVYEADGLAIDLRFEPSALAKRISLTGQVLDKLLPRTSCEAANITLWTDKGLALGEAQANAFGEFHLDFELQDNLRLSIQVAGHTLIRIPLGSLRAEQGSQSSSESDVSN